MPLGSDLFEVVLTLRRLYVEQHRVTYDQDMTDTVRFPLARLASALLVMALLAAACASSSTESAEPDSGTVEAAAANAESTEDTTGDPASAAEEAEEAYNPFPDAPEAPEFVEIRDSATDSGIPADAIENPTGSVGFSRYVYSNLEGEVVPFLVEGPRGAQTRCQEVELPCTYLELKELSESGAEIPEELNMDRDTLDELVGQLNQTADWVAGFDSIDHACERGFAAYTVQNANMGIHMVDVTAFFDGFDPARPEVVLFASPSGDGLTMQEQGNCGPDGWTGAKDYQAVGAVFLSNLSESHPEGFAGDIDNWHVHYNTCVGVGAEGSPIPRELCTDGGGSFYDVLPQWMMHAYTAEEFENQAGVFSMWNPTVWPLADTNDLETDRSQVPDDDGNTTFASINNFDYGDLSVGVGERLVISNSDSVPHTFTAGTPVDPLNERFDSGAFGTGQAYELTFDQAGTFDIYCVLHPSMTAEVVVG